MGSAYGTARAGVGIASVGQFNSDLVYKSLIPVVMAGILGIYGLIIAVILQGRGKQSFYFINKFPFSHPNSHCRYRPELLGSH